MDKNNALKLVDRIWYRCEEIEERPTDGYRMLPDIMELKEEIRSCSCLRWIPVSERLPEIETEVIVFSGLLMWIAFLTKEKVWEIVGHDETYDQSLVTHWMPLPEPPQEVE